MKNLGLRLLLIGIVIGWFLVPVTVVAGGVVTCFSHGLGGTCSRRVLTHVEFKSLILQYVDSSDTKLGEGLSRLLWREVLESISDLDKAGVILAYDRQGKIEEALGEQDLQAFLARDYHDAAIRIGEQQETQMVVWGAVLEDGPDFYIQNFLTLLQPNDKSWNRVSVSIMEQYNLGTVIGRTRLNLPPLIVSRDALFNRSFNTRCGLRACPGGVDVRAGPSNDYPVVGKIPEGARIQVKDMHQQWFLLEGETPRWINLYHLDMLPEHIWFKGRRGINLRKGPMQTPIAQVDLEGEYTVLNARRHGQFDEPWYKIQVGDNVGWVAGRLVHRRSYLFPSVHLIAGLYRFGRGQYDRAAKEFEAFIAVTDVEENVIRAAAYKLLAASRLSGRRRNSNEVGWAMADLNNASELTPYDPDLYTLMAVVKLANSNTIPDAFVDLENALRLDPRNASALSLTSQINMAVQQPEFQNLLRDSDIRAMQEGVLSLQKFIPR